MINKRMINKIWNAKFNLIIAGMCGSGAIYTWNKFLTPSLIFVSILNLIIGWKMTKEKTIDENEK